MGELAFKFVISAPLLALAIAGIILAFSRFVESGKSNKTWADKDE